MKVSGFSSCYASQMCNRVSANNVKANSTSFGNKTEKDKPVTVGATTLSQVKLPPATQEWLFICNATNSGARFERIQKNGAEEITLYDYTRKSIFAKYKVEDGKIKEKTAYIDGKPDEITEYRPNGYPLKTTLLTENGEPNLVFDFDEKGNYLKTGIEK